MRSTHKSASLNVREASIVESRLLHLYNLLSQWCVNEVMLLLTYDRVEICIVISNLNLEI